MLLNLDFCTDLLTERQFGKSLLKILQLPIGTWSPLHEVLGLNEYKYEDSKIFVSWTKSFYEEEDFSLILFCEENTLEMVTGNYNVGYLYRSFSLSE